MSVKSGVDPDTVEQELISNIMIINGDAPSNDADIYHWRQTGLNLMGWTEDDTDNPAWISMGLADIALKALLIPGIRPASFLLELAPLRNVFLPDNNIPPIFRWRQPGMSILVISDEDLVHGWA